VYDGLQRCRKLSSVSDVSHLVSGSDFHMPDQKWPNYFGPYLIILERGTARLQALQIGGDFDWHMLNSCAHSFCVLVSNVPSLPVNLSLSHWAKELLVKCSAPEPINHFIVV